MSEYLTAAALVRNGSVESYGFRAHWEIRAELGDENPSEKNYDDDEGFLTNTGRFVDRHEAIPVAVGAGQINAMWLRATRTLLSSDIDWDAPIARKGGE